MSEQALLRTEFKGIKLFRRGKVRDVYDLGEQLLIVSTDRISCFDVVLPCGIPYKGKILTSISLFWFGLLKDVLLTHFICADIDSYPKQLKQYAKELEGRSMLVLKSEPFAVECIVRGYLSGSAWKEYQENKSVCGIELPGGLRQSDKLPQPIFTPSTKAESGHDQNVQAVYVEGLLGKDTAARLKQASLAIYEKAGAYALKRGIIVADTKFEFGMHGGNIILIDEVLTPDSSRFWPVDSYSPGRAQPSFDKQFVRDYLESLSWNKLPPAPHLPEEIIEKTSAKYMEAYRRLTGKTFNG